MKRRIALAGLLAATLLPVHAQAQDTGLISFDGTPIAMHWFTAPGGGRAPVVLLAYGYGESGPATPTGARLAGAATVSKLLAAGYHVVTWDARGHGASGGTADFDNPDREARDVIRIIDWIAARPWAQLDGAGDPRLGMTGASYGGIIQYQVAALDPRVDAITPAYTGWSLADTTISQNGKFKEGWGLFLAGIGLTTIPAGLTSPFGPSLHTPSPETTASLTKSMAAGTLDPDFRAYLDKRSPSSFLSRVNVPTLIQGGTSDTLFPLINAVGDFRELKRRHVPVQMLWNCEGHSRCPGKVGPLVARFDGAVLRWFDKWLKRKPVDVGEPFEWIADNEGGYRSAGTFPPPSAGSLRGSGSGQLALLPTSPITSLSVPLLGATPSAEAVDVPIAAPSRAGDVAGFPEVTMTYQGTGTPAQTWVYGQIVDKATSRVVGAQTTPIPVVLDGKRRTVHVSLNAIATRATPASRYRLQIAPGSLIFGLQRTLGTVKIETATVSLPLVDATAHPALRLQTRRAIRLTAITERYHQVRLRVQRKKHGHWVTVARRTRNAVGLQGRTFHVHRQHGVRYRVVVKAVDAYGNTVLLKRRWR